MKSRFSTTEDVLDLRHTRTRLDALRLEARQPAALTPDQDSLTTQPRASSRHGMLLLGAAVRMASIALVVVSGAYGVSAVAPSLSYFMDTEAAPLNALGSSALAITAGDDGNADLSCGTHAEFPVAVDLVAPRGGAYSAHAVIAPSSDAALCEALALKAYYEGTKEYGGTIEGLTTGSISEGGAWRFTVDLGESLEDEAVPNGTVCTFDVVFSAYCPMLGYQGGGFTDDDAVTFTIAKNECEGPDCPCVSCGDVEIHIDSTTKTKTITIIESNAGSGDVVVLSGAGSIGGDGGDSSVTTDGVEAGSDTTAEAEGGTAKSESTTQAYGEADSSGGDGGDAGAAWTFTGAWSGDATSEVFVDGGQNHTEINVEVDNCCCECEGEEDRCGTGCGSEWSSSWSTHETRTRTERSYSFDGVRTHVEERTSTETHESSGEEGGTTSGQEAGSEYGE